jgi:hypothetical protein
MPIPLDRFVVVATIAPQFESQFGSKQLKAYMVAVDSTPVRMETHVQLATMFSSIQEARDLVAKCQESDAFGSGIQLFHVAKVTLNITKGGSLFLTDHEVP